MAKKTTAQKLDAAADALHRTGQKIAGEKGAKIAQHVSAAVLGRYLEECSDACGWCNSSHT